MNTILKCKKIFVLVLSATFLFTSFAIISEASLLERVNEAKGSDGISQLEEKADEAGSNIAKGLRGIAVIIAVLAFIFIAYGMYLSPNLKTLLDSKAAVGALFLATFIAFGAELIVGTFLGWMGW